MITWTNRHKLPEPFVRAVINDPYDKGPSNFSATGLSEPPRAKALLELHDVEVDVSTRVASIIGQGAHSVAERAARPGIDICEKRFFADFVVDGTTFVISSQIDLYETDTGALFDWKTTKAYAFSKAAGYGNKVEWRVQLNICAEIMRRNGHEPKSLNIIALLKDWNEREAEPLGKLPKTEVMAVSIAFWERDATVRFIEDRVRAHIAAKEVLPECTRLESWDGRKCSRWCDAASVCLQYQKAIKTGRFEDTNEGK